MSARGSHGGCSTQPDMTDPPRGSNISAVRTQSCSAASSCMRSSIVAPDSSGTPESAVRVGFPAVCDSMVLKVRAPAGTCTPRSIRRLTASQTPVTGLNPPLMLRRTPSPSPSCVREVPVPG